MNAYNNSVNITSTRTKAGDGIRKPCKR